MKLISKNSKLNLRPSITCKPKDSLELVKFIRVTKQCDDPIIIYTGYNEHEKLEIEYLIDNYKNIIIKYGRFLIGDAPHYDEVLGVNLASNNQYAKLYI